MNSNGFKISNPCKVDKNILIGSVDLELPSGLKINGVMLHEKAGQRWLGLPSKEWITKEGLKRYLPVIEFVLPDVKERFQTEVLALVEDALR
jgi:hypothetical protein